MNQAVPSFNANDCRHMIECVLLLEPGDVTEVRTIGSKGVECAGYFDNVDAMLKAIEPLTRNQSIDAFYVVLNRTDPRVLARYENRMQFRPKVTTSDHDIVRRRWILVDIDVDRPTGISASEEELEAALDVGRKVYNFLIDEGFRRESLATMNSGNGCYVLVRCDLANNDPSRQLVERFLKGLAAQFDTDQAHIDQKTFNASRIAALCGTRKGKGDSTPARPHRMVKPSLFPDQSVPASEELLQQVADLAPEPTQRTTQSKQRTSTTGRTTHSNASAAFDMDKFIEDNAVEVINRRDSGGYRRWCITCPFDANHTGSDAFIGVRPTGEPMFSCSHNSCKDNHWEQALEKNGWKSSYTRQARADTPDVHYGIKSFDDIEPQAIQWLWPGRVAFGKINLLDGDPGLGKSQVTIALAAAITTGKPMPGCLIPREKASVLLVSYEDGEADTLAPRLIAAGADRSRVLTPDFYEMVEINGREERIPRPPVLPNDLYHLEQLIIEHKVQLLVIDPLTAALDGAYNVNRDQDVRRALAPLANMAERTNVAVIIVRHMNKATGNTALYRGGGSIAIAGAARSVLMVAVDPNDENKRILAPVKSNISRMAEALSFGIKVVQLPTGEATCIEWFGTVDFKADELVADSEETSRLNEAVETMRQILMEEEGPLSSAVFKQECTNAGITGGTYDRARQKLKLKSTKEGKNWFVSLPSNSDSTPGSAAEQEFAA